MGSDGTDKSNVGRARSIAYHAPTSVEHEALKQKIVDAASPEAIAALDPLNHKPMMVIADASTLSDSEWQAIRKDSVGSSASAQVFGESLYSGATNLDLYNQKVGIIPMVEIESEEEKANTERIFAYGHIMEAFVRFVAAQMLDAEIVTDIGPEHDGKNILVVDTNIYAPNGKSYMTTNLDAMYRRADGVWEHVEFKTASYFVKDKFDNNSIPNNYRRQLIQCQHITGVWKSHLFAAFSRDEIIHRQYIRDLDAEYEHVQGIDEFWLNHVLPQIPPEPLGDPESIMNCIWKYTGNSVQNTRPVNLTGPAGEAAIKYMEIEDKIKVLKKDLKFLESQQEALLVPIAQQMGRNEWGVFTSVSSGDVSISWKETKPRETFDAKRFAVDYPDLAEQYKKTGVPSRKMKITRK